MSSTWFLSIQSSQVDLAISNTASSQIISQQQYLFKQQIESNIEELVKICFATDVSKNHSITVTGSRKLRSRAIFFLKDAPRVKPH